MKHRLIVIALLWSIAVHGAQYTINLGTTGNDGTGDNLRTGGGKINTNFNYLFGILGTSNTITYGSNTLRFTNICQTVTQSDTNTAIVSAGGTAGANGTYVWSTENYTNTAGAGYGHGIYSDGIDFILTNSSGGILYSLSDNGQGPSGSWLTVTGANPPPTSTLGDTTNCTTMAVFTGQVDAENVLPRGVSVCYAGQSLSNAIKRLTNGQMLLVGPGHYYLRGIPPLSGSTFYAADLEITNKRHITIKGIGKPRFQMTNDGIAMAIRDSDTILMDGIEWIGWKTNSGTYNPSGFSTFGMIQGSGTNRFLRWEHCDFTSNNMFTINLLNQSAGADWRCYDSTFAYCVFNDSGHTNMPAIGFLDGGAIQAGPSASMYHCTFNNFSRGIENYSAGGGLPAGYTLTVAYCTFSNGWSRNIFNNGGGSQHSRHQILYNKFAFDNARISPGMGGAIVLAQTAGATVEGNTMTNLLPSSATPCVYAIAPAYGDSRDVQIINNDMADCKYGVWYFSQLGGRISGNRFSRLSDIALWIAASDTIISENTFEQCGTDAANAPISGAGTGTTATNMVFVNNTLIRRSGTQPIRWFDFDSSCRGTVLRDNLISDPGTTPLLQDQGINTTVKWPEKLVYATLTAGTYTNAENDTMSFIPVSGQRTNKLRTPFRGHTMTVVNAGQNATAVVVRAMSGLIFNGSAFAGTNEMSLGTNYGSSGTFTGDGTNWFKVAGTP